MGNLYIQGSVKGLDDICAFCRKPGDISLEEEVKQTKNRMEANNALAFYRLAVLYHTGERGMPQNVAHANELYLRAGELGCAEAYYNLGSSYDNGRGVEMDKKKAKYYFELSAMNGSVHARYNLGLKEATAGNIARSMKHFLLGANAGDKKSLDMVKAAYMDGIVTKDEYADTLHANQKIQDEIKSDDRDKAEEFYRAIENR